MRLTPLSSSLYVVQAGNRILLLPNYLFVTGLTAAFCHIEVLLSATCDNNQGRSYKKRVLDISIVIRIRLLFVIHLVHVVIRICNFGISPDQPRLRCATWAPAI
jgi:hypothetical protein